MQRRLRIVAAILGTLPCVGGPAIAQERQDHHRREAAIAHAPGLFLDLRHHHDHYYPSRGYVVPALPGGSVSIAFGGSQYYFHAGVWFRPKGNRFVVIVPPVGIVAPVLPPAFVTLWIGGAPYYYANDLYYAPATGPGYMVVPPPPGVETARPVPPPPVALPPPAIAAPAPTMPPNPTLYPRIGQSAAQTDADRQECHRWATTQPGMQSDAAVIQRAETACMDGLGYSAR